MTWVKNFLERLDSTTSLDGVQELVVELRDRLGVEHAIYHIVGGTGREYGALTYDPDWVKHYVDSQYFRIDPVVNAAFLSHRPIDWKTLNWRQPAARRLIREAVDEGVGKQGYTVPIRGVDGQFALFTVTSYDSESAWDRFGAEHLHHLVLCGHYIHQRAAEIMAPDPAHLAADLSARERDVLTLLSLGHSRGEAAERLSISEHTFRAYLDTARLKLNAANTVHAVASAVTRGLILP